jgi:hypothetical protein
MTASLELGIERKPLNNLDIPALLSVWVLDPKRMRPPVPRFD